MHGALRAYVAGASLLLVFCYGILIIYLYALVAFAFFRELHPHDEGLYCKNAYQCFVTYVHHGLVIGTYEVSLCIRVGLWRRTLELLTMSIRINTISKINLVAIIVTNRSPGWVGAWSATSVTIQSANNYQGQSS